MHQIIHNVNPIIIYIVLGVGGETGWGAIGEPIEKALNTVCALLDGHLNKIWNIQQKSGQHDNEEWDDDNSVISELSSNVG